MFYINWLYAVSYFESVETHLYILMLEELPAVEICQCANNKISREFYLKLTYLLQKRRESVL